MRLLACLLTALLTVSATAQTFYYDDDTLREMYRVGIDESQTRALAHQLLDVIGPRLAGSEGLEQSQDWLIETYQEWGVATEKQEIGTWSRWKGGILHVDMLAPRVTSLEAELKAWSPATNGPVTGDVLLPPSDGDIEAWKANVAGNFVLLSAPEEMCRARQELEANAQEAEISALNDRRVGTARAHAARLQHLTGLGNAFRAAASAASLVDSLGAAGTLESRWSGGWGVNKVFATNNQQAVSLDVSCEDYGLLYRLVANGTPVRLRVNAEAEFGGEVPQFNVIARMEGSELPDEYVILGAHLDSWHAATGATDNGTGTLTMLEAARILKETYPNPRRTILIGHWANEEVGLVGSAAFREDNPEIMEGVQAMFNQDNGTWAFERLEGQAFAESPMFLPRWAGALPAEWQARMVVEVPGAQNNAGSDHTSFVCAGIPSFRLQSPYDEYRQYTWHTNRDTFDKVMFDHLAMNATTAAIVAYMASEDERRFGREKALLPPSRNGMARSWRGCRDVVRSSGR
ncbi:MAG: M20/M25/M40 family metallo-hydrolase [Rhodothermales bacterium]|nr:M20/M25/M40 family metallo-hydrolase [Rhodothermales bacterium]MBO6780265.1 M20/M25/M40 family metallo-hydrolase [Rhodothermales bacterium]